jgi:5-methylcytosine-specific restriction endonuclease McrA
MPYRNSEGLHNLCPRLNGKDYGSCPERAKAIQRTKAKERAKKWVRIRVSIPQEVRRMVANRDRYKCVYCHVSLNNRKCHVDHVIPLSQGGSNDADNLALTCVDCNQAKHTNVWQFGCRS